MILRIISRLNRSVTQSNLLHCKALTVPYYNYSVIKNKNCQTKKSIESHSNRQTLLIHKNDRNSFGSFNTKTDKNPPNQDPGDIAEENFINYRPLRKDQLPIDDYVKMIKQHIKTKCIKEAIDVLEVRMKNDRVKPDRYIFELLILECGRLGYAKKAFQLYNKLKQRDLKVTNPIYAGLFNACANTEHPQAGLKLAQNLRRIMIQNNEASNEIIANTMIKAFGRCGDIQTAFELVDEMREKKLRLEVKTMNHLMHACCSNKEFGFRHALLIWHKIYQRKMQPDIYTFNLMLRCVRDCGMGDLDSMRKVITMIFDASEKRLKLKLSKTKPVVLIDNKPLAVINQHENDSLTNVNDSVEGCETKEILDQMPNLLAKLPHLGSLIQLNEVNTPQDRLLLLGGLSGFIKEMEELKVRPGPKTFTQLLDCIPSTREAEHELIEKMREVRVRADTDLFNMLMKRRILRGDDLGAKLVLDMIQKVSLSPDIVTYGIMAIGCTTRQQAQEFLTMLKQKGIKVNNEILGALLKNVRYCQDDEFAADILNCAIEENLKPNDAFYNMTVKYKSIRYKYLEENVHKNDEQWIKYHNFFKTYKNWRQKMDLPTMSTETAQKLLNVHPWKQFKENQPTGIEPLKNTKKRLYWKRQHGLQKLNATRIQRMHENMIESPSDNIYSNEDTNKKNSTD